MSGVCTRPQGTEIDHALSVRELREKLVLFGYFEEALFRVHEKHFGRRVHRLEELTLEELEYWLHVMDWGTRRGAAGV